ncbi:hypothetical protein LEP1GSC047_1827 [Leptospira inadai serovar Lyme str. 10]|uniref:DUF3575 domain-containing protein n=2 Tax=Leptospira inadai serovar Lyme TaxID=293084 RepID=V6H983_9LEPT|nr:hypothetical protein [Leptospira inadai]EQA35656.1 hypothetical protein LEP1GSC047_1827 [Leptospira inadai serovar Lyme str. 10]PNV73951.1 hypothetical protein BES34_016155 [Leptospira inadai serovar Lyme]
MPEFRRKRFRCRYIVLLICLGLPFFPLWAEDAIIPSENPPPSNSETKESPVKPNPVNVSPPAEKSRGPEQVEIREKFKNQIGGFGFDRFFSFQYVRLLNPQWAVGAMGYTNTNVNRFDNDIIASLYFQPTAFYGRLSDNETKYWGGSVFIQRYVLDSPFFVALHLGREHRKKQESVLYWETLGGTYRYEKDTYNWGPQSYAGLGIGFRYQAMNGIFFGWEGIWNWYLPYKNSYQVSDLFYSDHQATLGDLLYRTYALQNRYTHPGANFALNLVIGFAF